MDNKFIIFVIYNKRSELKLTYMFKPGNHFHLSSSSLYTILMQTFRILFGEILEEGYFVDNLIFTFVLLI